MRHLLFFVFMLCLPAFLWAQTGVVKGRVTDELGLPMPGATVLIPALNKGVAAGVDGNFTLMQIPEGTQTVEVSYIGYEKVTQEATVEAGKTTELFVRMAAGVLIGKEVLVLGDRLKGQAKALNRQRTNMNISNIVAADQIGRFPDANIGDAMKRIPGIAIQNDQGEARFGLIRGTAPRLNAVTINGERIPSAEAEVREVQLDLIPSDMVQSIEVSKALTPDMDADAIGGSVNLVTRSAPEGMRISGTLGSGYNFLSKKPIWTGGLVVGNRFANNKLGVILGISYNNHTLGSDNIEAEWKNEAKTEIDGKSEKIKVPAYIGEFDIRTYKLRRVRRSYSLALDYKINANHALIFRTIYNWRDDWENRYRIRYRKIRPIFTKNTRTIEGFEGTAKRQTKGGIDNNRIKNQRLEDQRVWNFSLSGDHLIASKLKFDWMFSYARASEERKNERYITFEVKDRFDLVHDVRDPRFPLIKPKSSANITNKSFVLDDITEETRFTQDKDLNGRLNLEIPVSLFDKGGFLKIGGRLRSKHKNRDNSFIEYSPKSGIESLADVPRENITNPDFLAGSQYAAGEFTTRSFLGKLKFTDKNLFKAEDKPDEYLAKNFDATEDITAAYLMLAQNISPKLSFIAGLRAENTNIQYTGNSVLDEEKLQGKLKNSDSYLNLMPGLHLKYEATDDFVVRMAYTNTIARPSYYDLVPYRDQRNEDEEIFLGNPNLKPTTSMNLDLSAENYFESIGIVSAGLFYKNVNDFIFVSAQKNYSDAQVKNFDKFQPQNGAKASLYGFELAFQRQLDFLPGIWKGLGVYLNYTYTKSNASGIRDGDGELRTDNVTLPGTTPQMWNASLSFETKKLVIRTSANYAAAYLDEVGDDPFTDRYYDKQFFLDLNASYAFAPQWRIFFEANNLTNQPLRYYQGISARTMQTEYYNRRFNLGVKFDIAYGRK